MELTPMLAPSLSHEANGIVTAWVRWWAFQEAARNGGRLALPKPRMRKASVRS